MMELSHIAIARAAGVEVASVARLVRRALPKKWRRCDCGAMADRSPCLACALIVSTLQSIRPIRTR
jgi:hypothetical protein